MDDQNKNLILATALSFLVILAWFVLFPPQEPTVDPNAPTAADTTPAADVAGTPTTAPDAGVTTGTTSTPADTTPDNAVASAPRISIETPRINGSISLAGGRIDRLLLRDYRTELADDSPEVTLLVPAGEPDAYYTLFGWAPGGDLSFDAVPGAATLWQLESGDTLTPETPVTLRWDNGAGLIFHRRIEVDKDYLFTVTQSVENNGQTVARMAPYSLIARHGEPKNIRRFFILHEGAIAMTDGELHETKYKKVTGLPFSERDGARAEAYDVTTDGWIGFTDHFWMTILIPQPGHAFRAVTKYDENRDIYQTEAMQKTRDIAPGQSVSVTSSLFAGAKEWETIRRYQNENGVDRFVDSIDWGWFFFLTKPIFAVLHWLNGVIGNMGWSIICLTVVIKAIVFPLAFKSYVSMAKMKELQPQIEKIKEKVEGDRGKLQQEMMALYKKEKVNPASGCLPILIQIPIFFSLYKVIFVTLELRHAAWLGWIRDLSAPDPSSILNLFGLLSFAPPDASSALHIISLGVLPILLGISMWLQQKLNPAPTDATQAMIFAWMPWVFMFMLGGFASGLVLYWITNNTITFTQQYIIMRSQGFRPDVFGNIRSSFARKSKTAPKKK